METEKILIIKQMERFNLSSLNVKVLSSDEMLTVRGGDGPTTPPPPPPIIIIKGEEGDIIL